MRGVCVLAAWWALAGSTARAEGPGDAPGDALDAMPGIARVGLPEPLRRGFVLALATGYGYTESFLEGADSHNRASAVLGISYRPLTWLGASLRLDGRWDRHELMSGTDSSFISDPRISVRASRTFGSIALGGQATVWMPGESPLELDASGTSADLVALASMRLGATRLGLQAGYRLDRSAETVIAAGVGPADRLALGLSDSNAVLLGAGAAVPVGARLELLGEWTWDLLVGGDAPSARVSPMRLTAGARWRANRAVALSIRVDVAPNVRPALGPSDPLVPVEPLVAGLVGLTVGLEADPVARSAHVDPVVGDEARPVVDKPAAKRVLRGRVVTAQRGPVNGAQVQVIVGARAVVISTDSDGRFEVEGLPSGPVEVRVNSEGRPPVTRTLPDGAGDYDIMLEESTWGQLKGLVSSFAGQALQATIVIAQSGLETTTDADGAFVIDLPPGTYSVVIRAPGYAEQTRNVKIEASGVTVLNVDLRKVR